MPAKKLLFLIAHDIRSAHNVGSLLRTAEGLGVECVYLTGYTPYPTCVDDERLPHIANKLSQQISKTALGAEHTLDWRHQSDAVSLIKQLKQEGFEIAALEQMPNSVELTSFKTQKNLALILGSEVAGVSDELLNLVSSVIEIKMLGSKESFNVVQATAMALFYLKQIA